MSHIAVIPARSGSKGVPGKNMLNLWGRSLIGWAALCAREAGLFNRIILSTDSQDYAEEGQRYGCWVPYLRPTDLASDQAPIVQTLLELMAQTPDGERWETITLLEPTCPLRTPQMVIHCARLVTENPATNCALTLTEVPLHYHAYKQFLRQEDGVLRHAHPQGSGIRNRQELQPTYIRNGAAYTMQCASLREQKQIIHGQTQGLIVSDPLVNIDGPEDIVRLREIEAQQTLPSWMNTSVSIKDGL